MPRLAAPLLDGFPADQACRSAVTPLQADRSQTSPHKRGLQCANIASLVLAMATGGLLATGCTHLPTGVLERSQSWVNPTFTTVRIMVLQGLKLVVNVVRDGFAGGIVYAAHLDGRTALRCSRWPAGWASRASSQSAAIGPMPPAPVRTGSRSMNGRGGSG